MGGILVLAGYEVLDYSLLMKIRGAVIKEQGVSFAVVVVKRSAVSSSQTSNDTQESMRAYFPHLPIVLASQDSQGRFEYWGRKDLVNFLASIDPSRIPWREYTLS